jgi:GNAT superfamily N-acetyltransferase
MQIHAATPDHAEAISALIQSVRHHFTLHPDGVGAEAFLQGIEPGAIRSTIQAPNIRYYVGLVDQKLAGVVAMRDATHLYHLFVQPAFQGQGLGRALWQHARDAALAAGHPSRFTVNSSPYAVPVYVRFGFAATGPRVDTRGIAFVPMELRLDAAEQGG